MIEPKAVILITVTLVGVGLAVYGFIRTQFGVEKGPEDIKTKRYVAAYLREKYGYENGVMRIHITKFIPDVSREAAGWYSMACKYANRPIIVKIYYDGVSFRDLSEGRG